MSYSWKPLLAGSTILAAGILTSSSAAWAEGRVKAVASFSILGDFVSRVGGDSVEVTTIVGPNGDAHVYEPKPGDAKAVAAANVVFVNGLGFEGWLDRLVDASGYEGTIVKASEGIATLKMKEGHEKAEGEEHVAGEAEHGHGGFDPHGWQSVANALIYVKNIAGALCAVDAAGCDTYNANAETYSKELEAVAADIEAAVATIPRTRRTVITSHDAFGYFSHAFGIEFVAPEGISTESEASAKDVAKLIEQIKEDKASALFVENVSDPRLIEQIGRETGLTIGGALYSDALSEKDGPAPTYIEMMRHNTRVLIGALTPRS